MLTSEAVASADDLRSILKRAAQNESATLDHEERAADFLSRLNATFLSTNSLLVNSPDSLLIMFLGRAHSAVIGAVRMAASGQLPETFMLLRGALENSFYALHIKCDKSPPDRFTTWINRSQGPTESKRCRNEFTIANVMASLRQRSPSLHSVADQLYGRCLDLGGHPNQRGHFAASTFTNVEPGGAAEFKVDLFTPNIRTRRFLLRSCAEVGILVLRVFVEVFTERFKLTSLPQRTEDLHRELSELCAPDGALA
jgi:hypothetical protein